MQLKTSAMGKRYLSNHKKILSIPVEPTTDGFDSVCNDPNCPDCSPQKMQSIVLPNGFGRQQPDELENTLSLFGNVDEKRSEQICLILSTYPKRVYEESEEKPEIEFVISTPGGSAYEMFAMYDMMEYVKRTHDIKTIGLGQVMSAGVLLMAAGTRGKRFCGKNTQIMVHEMKGTFDGRPDEIKNEHKQMSGMQKTYIDCLVANSTMSLLDVKKLFRKKKDFFLSSTEALSMGLIDHIL